MKTVTLNGQPGSNLGYNPATDEQTLENQGYEIVKNNIPDNATFSSDPSQSEHYTITVKHGTTTLGPNNQHEAGTPINPNDPNGAKWPAKDTYSKSYTSTVHFVGPDGQQLTNDNVQTSTWTRTVTIDKVTGKVISGTDWTTTTKNYQDVQVPVVNGYVASQKTVTGQPAVQKNLTTTVTYQKLGQIVPVDHNGNPIGNAQTYRNDPNDPTKVVPNEAVPMISGYTPSTSTVTPTNPSVNTTITYNKNGNGNQNNSTNGNGSTTNNGGAANNNGNGSTANNGSSTNQGGTTNNGGTTANNGNSTVNDNSGTSTGNSGLTNGTGSATTEGNINNNGANFSGSVETTGTGAVAGNSGAASVAGNAGNTITTTTTTSTGSNNSNSGNNITLPQTGNTANKAAILGAAGVELAATLGLAGLAARKKHDVE